MLRCCGAESGIVHEIDIHVFPYFTELNMRGLGMTHGRTAEEMRQSSNKTVSHNWISPEGTANHKRALGHLFLAGTGWEQ